MSDWHLYLVRTRDGDLYTGIATDVTRRLAEHTAGGVRGSKFLRSRGPLELAYQVRLGDRSIALRAEHRLKKLSRLEKQAIVDDSPAGGDLLALLAIAQD